MGKLFVSGSAKTSTATNSQNIGGVVFISRHANNGGDATFITRLNLQRKRIAFDFIRVQVSSSGRLILYFSGLRILTQNTKAISILGRENGDLQRSAA